MFSDLVVALPEITLFTLLCLSVLFGSIWRHQTAGGMCIVRTGILAQCSLWGTALIVLLTMAETSFSAFHGSYIHDPVASLLKLAVCVGSAVAFMYSAEYFLKHGLVRGEYYILGLFAVLGMMILISAGSLLTVYLGLELMSLSLYAMVAMHHRSSKRATEAAIKYFVLGAIASGMLLYGMSILYGLSGSLELILIAQHIIWCCQGQGDPWFIFAMVFIIVGIAFKIGAVPFHAWLPDVYQGAPTAVTLFLSSMPKLAAFGMMLRLLASAMAPMIHDWQAVLAILAILSLALGNTLAILQSNLKRMLAYSAIAHGGFILLGMIAGPAHHFSGALFYVLVYAFTSMGAFSMLILLGRKGTALEAENLDECKGLAQRSPWFALMMLFFMFSMAGVPPFAGFWAKWFVLSGLVQSHWVWLAVLAVCFSIIGAFYYLRVVKLMYFDDPDPAASPISSTPRLRWLLSVNGLLVLLLGLFPDRLMALCLRALEDFGLY
ncbi:MAG: NADH-quinone oxidoreductase subunit NuoN [Candidatus Eutrophobiaceae bacterium]